MENHKSNPDDKYKKIKVRDRFFQLWPPIAKKLVCFAINFVLNPPKPERKKNKRQEIQIKEVATDIQDILETNTPVQSDGKLFIIASKKSNKFGISLVVLYQFFAYVSNHE